ncbi:flagellar assembly protein FliH [Breznakiella homolactica]|uniref:Flagellar assembly protein FliH n=1 Tax=Breznakiella homolactica TaxID=2798577 RepID=A0A7T8B8K6_9SPIR|nr:flagellar assembly protein FliH [Breznakiella homolactica]QQO07416.1 flagellar assembly protein FliH [Breznakiella homolactica]
MAKAVFRPGEVVISDKKVFLDPPQAYPDAVNLVHVPQEIEELEDAEEYTGPTADDLRREAEAFKTQWDQEREGMISAAKAEAEAIKKEAEEAAFQEVKRRTDQAQSMRREAEDEAERIIAEAKQKAQDIEADARSAFDEDKRLAENEGRSAGREEGFNEGKAEAERLIERTQTILERAQDKRAEILAETEQQIIDLVLLISRKVIKVISENQRNVVISNVVQALRKVKGRGNIIIRVNMTDVKLTTEHMKDFVKLVEGAKSIQIIEDSKVDRGGCIIETEFGEIDARIASQLSELETKILELSPIKAKARTAPIDEG